MEKKKGSLPFSQQPTAGAYPETQDNSPPPHSLVF